MTRGTKYYDYHDLFFDKNDKRWREERADLGLGIFQGLEEDDAYFDSGKGCWIPSYSDYFETDFPRLNSLSKTSSEDRLKFIYDEVMPSRQADRKTFIDFYISKEWNKLESGFILRTAKEDFYEKSTVKTKDGIVNVLSSIEGVPTTVAIVDWATGKSNTSYKRRMIVKYGEYVHENGIYNFWRCHNTHGPAIIETEYEVKRNGIINLKSRKLTWALHGKILAEVKDPDRHSKGQWPLRDEQATAFIQKHS
jgi:hypothetical protein